MLELNKIYNMDCIEGMKLLDDYSVDLVLTDPPYNMTACEWDNDKWIKPFWIETKRILKDNGSVVVFSTQPFTTILINSNFDNFKYCYVWNKKKQGAINVGKYRPLQITEDICVFAYCNMKKYNYFPIMEKRDKPVKSKNYSTTGIYKTGFGREIKDISFTYTHKYPKNLLVFSNANQNNKLHPTQKPVELMEYLIITFSKDNAIILDSFIGSGTTALACKQLNRNFIGFEISKEYCKIAEERLKKLTTIYKWI